MKGLRTLITAFVSAYVTPLLIAKLGVALTPEQQAQLVAAIMGGIMIGMRLITTGPVGGIVMKAKPLVLTTDNALQHLDIGKLASLILKEIAKRRKDPPSKEPQQ